MRLISKYGQMWARNEDNIQAIPPKECGVYILFDGSMPHYVGKGELQKRIIAARKSERRGRQWDYFSWYVIRSEALIHDAEVLLLRILPFYLRIFTRQRGKFQCAK